MLHVKRYNLGIKSKYKLMFIFNQLKHSSHSVGSKAKSKYVKYIKIPLNMISSSNVQFKYQA